ncbi:MAG: hypothetical protein ACTSRW_16685, partial [Candidatus Helarchaeota archaeon]
DKRFETLTRSLQELSISVARIESKEGIFLEKVVLDLMKETLELEKVDPSKTKKEYLQDLEGAVFYKGYTTDVDVLLQNGNVYLVEVKTMASKQDVDHFLMNVKLYEKTHDRKVTKPILIALRTTLQAVQVAEQREVRFIYSTVLD